MGPQAGDRGLGEEVLERHIVGAIDFGLGKAVLRCPSCRLFLPGLHTGALLQEHLGLHTLCSFVHYRGCGWHGYNEVAQGESNAEQSDEGPYLEVPDEAEAESPKPEIEGWEKKSLNATSSEPSTSGWGRQFCAAHHVGYSCRGFTRVRCCRNTWVFTRCGSFAHYRGCGWHGRGYGYNEVAQGDSTAAQLPETAA